MVKKFIRKIQKLDKSKYWLPEGITLSDKNPQRYTKMMKIIFIDPIYGEFESTFAGVQLANASTHPKAVSDRRAATFIKKYGVDNISKVPGTREKAQNTMLEKYGVSHALKSVEFMNKSIDTLIRNHGVSTPMDKKEIRDKIKKTNLAKYGSENAMGNILVQMKQFYSTIESGNQFVSKGEREVKEFIESLGLTCKSKFIYEDNIKKQLDIYIEELNIAIEFNGLYWHCEANPKIYPNYHLDKTKMAKKQGIRTIQIFEHEWNDRNEQVKSFLMSAVNKNTIKLYARKCTIQEVPKDIARKFLESYHILGSPGFKKAIGLYYNDELISLATFGVHHRNNEEMVLSRFITKTGYNICGGLSRIVSHALNEYSKLATWIDLRWSTGDNWIKAGWSLDSILKPDYFYFDNKTGNTVSKQSRRKKVVNTPDNMTEHEHALSEKLYKIHDCGKLKLKIIKS